MQLMKLATNSTNSNLRLNERVITPNSIPIFILPPTLETYRRFSHESCLPCNNNSKNEIQPKDITDTSRSSSKSGQKTPLFSSLDDVNHRKDTQTDSCTTTNNAPTTTNTPSGKKSNSLPYVTVNSSVYNSIASKFKSNNQSTSKQQKQQKIDSNDLKTQLNDSFRSLRNKHLLNTNGTQTKDDTTKTTRDQSAKSLNIIHTNNSLLNNEILLSIMKNKNRSKSETLLILPQFLSKKRNSCSSNGNDRKISSSGQSSKRNSARNSLVIFDNSPETRRESHDIARQLLEQQSPQDNTKSITENYKKISLIISKSEKQDTELNPSEFRKRSLSSSSLEKANNLYLHDNTNYTNRFRRHRSLRSSFFSHFNRKSNKKANSVPNATTVHDTNDLFGYVDIEFNLNLSTYTILVQLKNIYFKPLIEVNELKAKIFYFTFFEKNDENANENQQSGVKRYKEKFSMRKIKFNMNYRSTSKPIEFTMDYLKKLKKSKSYSCDFDENGMTLNHAFVIVFELHSYLPISRRSLMSTFRKQKRIFKGELVLENFNPMQSNFHIVEKKFRMYEF